MMQMIKQIIKNTIFTLNLNEKSELAETRDTTLRMTFEWVKF